MKKILISSTAALLLCTGILLAQPPDGEGHRGQPGGRRMIPPVMAVLDTNHDGELSADEIANASKSLLTLDKNGDGKLDREELRPGRPDVARDGPPPRSDN